MGKDINIPPEIIEEALQERLANVVAELKSVESLDHFQDETTSITRHFE